MSYFKMTSMFGKARHWYTVLLLTILVGSLSAQDIQREVFSSAGNYIDNGSIAISQTIGEPITLTFDGADPDMRIVQGFEQQFGILEIIVNCQAIAIQTGWNIISANVYPDDADMMTILSDIASEIIILKDEAGSPVIPSIPLNLIGNWEVTEGYKVKSLSDTVLDIGCIPVVPETTPIDLPVGWSIVSYLRNDAMDASAALSSLGDSLIIAKNSAGQVYIPSLGLNNIGNMEPGQGYQVKMSDAMDLYYPANTGRLPAPAISYSTPASPTRLAYDGNTGNNATIVIPQGAVSGLDPGDEIGIYNNRGDLAGSGVYEGRNMAIAVWGNDAQTEDESHMADGEVYSIKVWKPSMGDEFELDVTYTSGENFYKVDGITYLGSGTVDVPETWTASTNVFVYPNPASVMIYFDLVLEEASVVTLEVYNVSGAVAMKNSKYELPQGQSVLDIDISGLASGEYFYRFSMADDVFNGRFVKVK